MSRRKSFIENLNTAEKAILEQEKKYGKSEDYRKRCHAILLSHRGYTVDQIVDFLEVSKGSVYKWFSTWRKDGLEGLKTKSGQGRKPTLRLDNADHVKGVKKAARKAVEEGTNLLLEIQQELEIEEPLTKRMLSLFLTKLIGHGNDVEEP